MDKPQIGINLPGGSSTPQGLETSLRRITDDGFDTVEIGMDTFPLIIGGEVKADYVGWLKARLAQWPLRYSGHIGRNVDLRSDEHYELSKEILYRSIEICGELSMSPLTLHFEVESDSREIEERFYRDHLAAAEYAAERSVLLCVENIEVERVDPIVRMIADLDHPNLRMTYDTGHGYLAAGYFGFDFLSSLRKALPLISHVHMSGNTGTFEPLRITNRPVYDTLPKGYRMAFGRGDIHAPPLWGTIPYHEILPLLKGYDGVFLCEYNSGNFLPFNRSIQESMRGLILRYRTADEERNDESSNV